jgi:hypothetical protein
MFSKTTPAAEVISTVEKEPSEPLVPLSHFALDHPQPPEGWSNFLGRRGITLRPDDIGRDSIRRSDAQMLLHEQRAEQLRQRKLAALRQEQEEEADKLRRSQIWTGLSADAIPIGVHPAAAMLQASKDARPRRSTPLEHALSNEGGVVFHPIGPGSGES